ncbi:hypothetical protein H2203_006334 [Taxawa tesnikishii (nom. ined.)]|nr:hypothetical protein H2203_006334 [Dothideales sp. JES 119]
MINDRCARRGSGVLLPLPHDHLDAKYVHINHVWSPTEREVYMSTGRLPITPTTPGCSVNTICLPVRIVGNHVREFHTPVVYQVQISLPDLVIAKDTPVLLIVEPMPPSQSNYEHSVTMIPSEFIDQKAVHLAMRNSPSPTHSESLHRFHARGHEKLQL